MATLFKAKPLSASAEVRNSINPYRPSWFTQAFTMDDPGGYIQINDILKLINVYKEKDGVI